MGYHIGIDAGSKTVKIVVLDDEGNLVCSDYRKHRSDIRTTLREVVHEMAWRFGDKTGPVCVTGSAGIGVSEMLGIPFVQEVVATTKAVKAFNPTADAVIELGGEDAKVIYLTGGLEQRMNATCAGGTGGFIDTVAFMLGVTSRELGRMALGSSTTYPIASRCAVFAQTDVRPLLNAGVRKADIAASVLDAVVRQTMGGLACGRPIDGEVVLLGGPFEFIPGLELRFSNALEGRGYKPGAAHLYVAAGAALSASEDTAPVVGLKALEERLLNSADPEDDLEHLPPLFESEEERQAFIRRHAKSVMPKSSFSKYEGDVYLGLDAGSTTVKIALVGDEGQLVYSDYQPTEGDALATAKWMLEEMYTALPSLPGSKEPLIKIKQAVVTGYGEDLMVSALGIDSGVVETSAHLKAALAFDPKVSFVLDIGGQDMKALWVKDGMISDAVLNEACSSGCGSFIEGIAYSLRSTPSRFAELALEAPSPIELGTKCTVFMTSRVRHAQKIGASHADIAAGLAYSVVQNALYRIIGRDKLASMGDHVVVQGGSFKSDAVLAAFEKISGLEVIRPDTAHLMGAIGAALIARERAQVKYAQQGRDKVASSFLSKEALKELSPARVALTCPGCQNACTLTKLSFGDDRVFVSGNRCQRAYEALGLETQEPAREKVPNVMKVQQGLLGQCRGTANEGGSRNGSAVGIVNTLFAHDQVPFWQALLAGLGFAVVMPQEQRTRELMAASAESIASESVCFPAKLSHGRLYNLVDSGAQAVFIPSYQRNGQCSVCCEYAQALADSTPLVHEGACLLCTPCLSSPRVSDNAASDEDRARLHAALNDLAIKLGEKPIEAAEFDQALIQARCAQEAYEERLAKATAKALDWVHQAPERHGIILAGRPYHVDPMLLHGIDDVLEKLGFAVLTEAGLRCALGIPQDADHMSAQVSWAEACRHADVVNWDIADDSLDAVFLQSFGCGFDSISYEVVRDQLSWHGLPCAILKIDDMIDTAHVRIRLRTLAQSIEARKAQALLSAELLDQSTQDAESVQDNPLGLGKDACQHLSGMGLDFGRDAQAPQTGTYAGGRFPQIAGSPMTVELSGAPGKSASGWDAAYFARQDGDSLPGRRAEGLVRPLSHEDLDYARGYVPSDMCFTAASLAARAISLAKDNAKIARVRLPKVCQGCMVDAIPGVVSRACNRPVVVEWTQEWPAATNQEGRDLRAPIAPEDPLRIGIVGNPLLCFESYLNDGLPEMLESLGCQCVLPDPAKLYVDDVRYLDQLQEYHDCHVDHVIYLQSFGCLKGHVHARGSLHELADLYPDMPVTVIDYDPEASALNRENRVRLAVEAAHSARPQAVMRPRPRSSASKWLGAAQGIVEEGRRSLLADAHSHLSQGPAALAYCIENGGPTKCGSLQQLEQELGQRRDQVAQELDELKRQATILELALSALESTKEQEG